MNKLNSYRDTANVTCKGDRKSMLSAILDKSNQSMSKDPDSNRQIGLEEESFNLQNRFSEGQNG